ncbi:helix-turn-helix domain-containing protein [Runella slithyformis]|uniref:Transcriptional regulator, AraC family n=1 Tax=Runella slithyformis (strain ATCC 29530 / DSM 19594 / LMG 11500 / NCIMB 11436 / LSU 4) TaxID=761193 RepID=A0A7U3ZMH4_RUNSL|nr:AraC family transcriptional regulator [Runella slithyformis]AEI49924.1 transcriptional regulator, AraC family [Runella slithyformis DSM 19594]
MSTIHNPNVTFKGTTLTLDKGLDAEFIIMSGKILLPAVEEGFTCLWESSELVRVYRARQITQAKTQFLSFREEKIEIEPLKKYRTVRLLKISISTEWLTENNLSDSFSQIKNLYDFVSLPSFYESLDAQLLGLVRNSDPARLNSNLRLKSALFSYLNSYFEVLRSPKVLKNDRLKIEWVVNNYMLQFEQPIPTITELSEQLSMSESKFKYLFKEAFGMPFYQYYQQKRMQQAAEWLKSGELNVTGVSQKLGYSHPIKFIGQFKKLFGVTPLRYAKGKE